MPLQDLLPRDLVYCFSKLYEGYWSGDGLAQTNLAAIAAYYANIKAELTATYGSYKQVDSVVYELESVGHALLRLQQMFESGSIEGNQDAKVFIDALAGYFEELKVRFIEIDAAG